LRADHLHLIVEADGRLELSRGVRAFEISAAGHVNRVISRARRSRRHGAVFPDRYNARILNSPKSAQNASRYVVNNWRKHREDRAALVREFPIDPFSSGISCTGWRDSRAGRGCGSRRPRTSRCACAARARGCSSAAGSSPAPSGLGTCRVRSDRQPSLLRTVRCGES
jgi:hypothetical protein